MDRPKWWHWEIEITPHAEKRMVQRDFTEIDLREMLESATKLVPDAIPGRWIASSFVRGRKWEIVIEPDSQEKTQVIITAYSLD